MIESLKLSGISDSSAESATQKSTPYFVLKPSNLVSIDFTTVLTSKVTTFLPAS